MELHGSRTPRSKSLFSSRVTGGSREAAKMEEEAAAATETKLKAVADKGQHLFIEQPPGAEICSSCGTVIGSPVSDNNKLRSVFEDNLKTRTRPVTYDRAGVLMLYWDEKSTDMDVTSEVQELKEVFEKDYNFSVRQEKLEAKDQPKPEYQIIMALMNFIKEYDVPGKSLCIIYYAGHGWGDEKKAGRLWLALGNEYNKIAWHSVEKCLANVDVELLLIFDCCRAGALSKYRGTFHSFEFLGACDYNQLTHKPGKRSFTSALIRTLGDLKDQQGFDSARLRRLITDAKDFPADEQEPVLFHRFKQDSLDVPHVWIAPLRPPGHHAAGTDPLPDHPVDAYYTSEYVDLRFHFSKPQDSEAVAGLAKVLNSVVHKKPSRFLGLENVTFRKKGSAHQEFQQAARHWLGLARLSSRAERRTQPRRLRGQVTSPSETDGEKGVEVEAQVEAGAGPGAEAGAVSGSGSVSRERSVRSSKRRRLE